MHSPPLAYDTYPKDDDEQIIPARKLAIAGKAKKCKSLGKNLETFGADVSWES